MNSNKEMQDLITSVYVPMLYYIPSKVLSLSTMEVTDDISSSPLFDTLFISMEDGKGSFYIEELHCLEVYKKETVFNSNLFKLLEIEGRNNVNAFRFLIEKYIGQVSSYADAFGLILDNVELDIPLISKTAINNLSYQKFITEKHLQDLKEHFVNYKAVPKVSFEKLIINNKRLKPITNNQRLIETPQNQGTISQDKVLNTKNKKQKKVVLATEEEVDLYLLNSVFNVKF